jgi:radical SAM-linked protein
MRYWIKFAKEGELRFISHLDLMRSWQRSIRRAGLPVAFSAGFNPHMRLSFASALPVGATSEAEYAEVWFTRALTDGEWQRLQEAMPEGLAMLGRREVPEGAASLMSLIGAAGWRVPAADREREEMSEALQKLSSSGQLPVEREGKKGRKTVDLRPLILELELCGREVRLLLKTGETGGTKPQEVLAAAGLTAFQPAHRTELYVTAGRRLQSPLAVAFNKKEVTVNEQKDYYQL